VIDHPLKNHKIGEKKKNDHYWLGLDWKSNRG